MTYGGGSHEAAARGTPMIIHAFREIHHPPAMSGIPAKPSYPTEAARIQQGGPLIATRSPACDLLIGQLTRQSCTALTSTSDLYGFARNEQPSGSGADAEPKLEL